MTRKDFVLIADVLSTTKAPAEVVSGMANALATTNPNFDRMRFIVAATR